MENTFWLVQVQDSTGSTYAKFDTENDMLMFLKVYDPAKVGYIVQATIDHKYRRLCSGKHTIEDIPLCDNPECQGDIGPHTTSECPWNR